jgi:hypothetical protein
MQRIDAWLDLAFQLAYLLGLTVLLLLQHRSFKYHLEVLHFFYGGLLSAYVVLYFRSSTLARPALFLALLVGVMFINEVPRVRSAGYRMRLGLYAFCVLSFLTYFIPILIGRIGGWIFLVSLLTTAAIVWVISGFLVTQAQADAGQPTSDNQPPTTDHRPLSARLRLCTPAAAVLVVIGLLYVLRLIPPVPLSVQFQGIYHEVRREGGDYTLIYAEPPPWAFWRQDSRPFKRRAGDRVHYFARVFAPSGFEHQVVLRWELYVDARGEWVTTDRIPLNVVGGRAEGFRGFAVKSNFEPGRWRVTAETDDGRAIATLAFDVEDDADADERSWRSLSAYSRTPDDRITGSTTVTTMPITASSTATM